MLHRTYPTIMSKVSGGTVLCMPLNFWDTEKQNNVSETELCIEGAVKFPTGSSEFLTSEYK